MINIELIVEIEDFIVPQLKLDIGEVRLYYFFLRNTILENKELEIFSVARIAETLNCSKNAVKPRLKSMQDKGIIDVIDSGWAGTKIKVFKPKEIKNISFDKLERNSINIEELDFFKNTNLRDSIFSLHGSMCFYCNKKLNSDNSALDHLVPQKLGGNNSYRNLVPCCHSCNSKKNDTIAVEYLRSVYRDDLISDIEFKDKVEKISKVEKGEYIPILN